MSTLRHQLEVVEAALTELKRREQELCTLRESHGFYLQQWSEAHRNMTEMETRRDELVALVEDEEKGS